MGLGRRLLVEATHGDEVQRSAELYPVTPCQCFAEPDQQLAEGQWCQLQPEVEVGEPWCFERRAKHQRGRNVGEVVRSRYRHAFHSLFFSFSTRYAVRLLNLG